MNFLLDTNAIIYLINGRLAMALPDGRYGVPWWPMPSCSAMTASWRAFPLCDSGLFRSSPARATAGEIDYGTERFDGPRGSTVLMVTSGSQGGGQPQVFRAASRSSSGLTSRICVATAQ